MSESAFSDHLDCGRGRGRMPADAFTGAAGGAACGDLIRVSIACADGCTVTDAGFDASGCGAAIAAGSAAVALVEGRPLLDAARVGAAEIAAELGGLIPAKMHAAELAADALHRALGAAARARGALDPDPGRTLVAMSGGVDSAVAALLCSRSAAAGTAAIAEVAGTADTADAPVVAVTLELWADPENDAERSCCSAAAVRGARAVAHSLGLPHFSLDLRAEFRAGVVDPWLADHAAGLTPNPCVRCNGSVRLDAMLEFAVRLGAEALATGHYARVRDPHDPHDPRDRRDQLAGPLLRAAADPAKDQAYMLAGLAPESLARMRFPLGDLAKGRVRELAAEAGLAVADKPDSQDLCFLAGTGRSAFLARHGGRREREGSIVDRRGRELGRHRGHEGYTVGQRRGLGVGGGEPLYVLATDARANTVTVGLREELATRRIGLRDVILHRPGVEVDRVKLRYRSPAVSARVERSTRAGRHASLEVRLLEPVAGAAPGQLATLMHGDLIVGHGTIASYTPAGR